VRLLVSQAKECEITVTLSDKTRSDGHKFKVCESTMGHAASAASSKVILSRAITLMKLAIVKFISRTRGPLDLMLNRQSICGFPCTYVSICCLAQYTVMAIFVVLALPLALICGTCQQGKSVAHAAL